jgi:hypothetical protein
MTDGCGVKAIGPYPDGRAPPTLASVRVRIDHYVELDVEPVETRPGEMLLRASKAGPTTPVGTREVHLQFLEPQGWSTDYDARLRTASDGFLEVRVTADDPLHPR